MDQVIKYLVTIGNYWDECTSSYRVCMECRTRRTQVNVRAARGGCVCERTKGPTAKGG